MDPELFNMARSGNVKSLNRGKIKEENTFLLHRTDKGNDTALHIACKFGRKEFAAKIISLCPELLLLQNSREDTALHNAARAGHAEVVRMLIECAEKQNKKEIMLGMVNMEDNTILHEAASNPNGEVVQVLIKEKPKWALVLNKAGASQLYVAAEKGCLKSVVHILSAVNDSEKVHSVVNDSEKVHCEGFLKRTPLHAAVIRQHLRITKKLIHERRDFIGQEDEFGNYPIHYAAAVGNLQMVHELLRADASTANQKNEKKQSPFYVAASNGHVNVIKELLRFCPKSCLSVDKAGCNALHVAAERGNLEVVKYILHSEYLVELINEPNMAGNTPLHLAITNGQLSISSFLIKDKRVDVNIKNKKGQTALDIAESNDMVTKKFEKIITCKALIQAKATRGLQRKGEKTTPRIDSYEGMSRVISTVAGLIIAVSFAAAFTIPGGFNSAGKAVLEKKTFLWLFIIADALALFASVTVELVLLLAAIGDVDLLVAAHSISIKLMLISLVSLALAFLFGLLSIVPIVLAVLVFFVLVVLLGLVLHWVRRFSWFPLFYSSLKQSIKDKLSSIICPCCSRKSTSQHLSSVPMAPPPQSSNQVESQPTNPPSSPAPIEIQGTNRPQISSSEILHMTNQLLHVPSQVEIQTTNPSQSPAAAPIDHEIQHTNPPWNSVSNALIPHINQPQSSGSLVSGGPHDVSLISDIIKAALSSETLNLKHLNMLINLIPPQNPVSQLMKHLRILLTTSPRSSASSEIPHPNQPEKSVSIEIGDALQSSIDLNSIIPRIEASFKSSTPLPQPSSSQTGVLAQDIFPHKIPTQPPAHPRLVRQHSDTTLNRGRNDQLQHSLSLSAPSNISYAQLLLDN